MFTGIIQAVGRIAALESTAGDCRMTIETGKLPLADAQLGDSIAVNGVCLTAVELAAHHFIADLSRETLSCTTMNDATVGTPLNLELALTPKSRLGGHFVSGHVDGIGTVRSKTNDGRSIRFLIETPPSLAKYIAAKGSVCIDGISLTVNRVNGAQFDVNIVPHTLQETTLGTTENGASVNLEVDLLARYIERLLLGERAAEANSSDTESTITNELLRNSGFID